MSIEHTPGPWKATYIGDKMVGFSEITSSNQLIVADHVWTMADAHLIAALPELLLKGQVLRNQLLKLSKVSQPDPIQMADFWIQEKTAIAAIGAWDKLTTQATGPAGESE